MITANIHRVKSISVRRIVYDTFVEHKIVFETEDGLVEVSEFAPTSLEVEMLPTRDSLVGADNVLAVGAAS